MIYESHPQLRSFSIGKDRNKGASFNDRTGGEQNAFFFVSNILQHRLFCLPLLSNDIVMWAPKQQGPAGSYVPKPSSPYFIRSFLPSLFFWAVEYASRHVAGNKVATCLSTTLLIAVAMKLKYNASNRFWQPTQRIQTHSTLPTNQHPTRARHQTNKQNRVKTLKYHQKSRK